MGQNAKATDFLKECMADALIQKMQEKPFEKVTVNEIRFEHDRSIEKNRR